MPPVREASTKPSAATVLPAPVACSNQKRRAAFGSSGCSARLRRPRRPSSSAARRPSRRGSSSSAVVLVVLELDPRRSGSSSTSRVLGRCRCAVARRRRPGPRRVSAISVPDSASTWWADSMVPSASFGSSSASRRSRPSISEYSRRHSTDGSSRPASISASAASSARRRAVPWASATAGVLALEHERLAREFLGALEVGAGYRRPQRREVLSAIEASGSSSEGAGRAATAVPVWPSRTAARSGRQMSPLVRVPRAACGAAPSRAARRHVLQHPKQRCVTVVPRCAPFCPRSIRAARPAARRLAGCWSRRPAEHAPTPAKFEAAPARPAAASCTPGQPAARRRQRTPSRRGCASCRGYPVVVNKWGSWCAPCRAEFPFFQQRR